MKKYQRLLMYTIAPIWAISMLVTIFIDRGVGILIFKVSSVMLGLLMLQEDN
jgi:hypothetical protein